ncbi:MULTISPECIES: lysozyme inhibitor LprI family protein [Burkholderia]|uniref:Lysozyme inhibitor LprI-like N-terminal domain-containing protein n=1 Tax=Burkholderia aenigmatica TaxID=2015348 RepID=A0A6J5JAG9_9BURK|nr:MULTISPECIES: lysozyme inhibitor LprI family protein [Burkholderia]CAB3968647.1 hypothetical protein BLA3211_05091 [Burkholderia aenigmatica]
MTIRSKLAPVTLLLAVLATRDAHAAPDCANPQDQRAMNECASRGYARADAELNRRYRALQRRLNGDRDGARKLTEAQRAWIAFRDTECAFQTIGVAGGGRPSRWHVQHVWRKRRSRDRRRCNAISTAVKVTRTVPLRRSESRRARFTGRCCRCGPSWPTGEADAV